MTSPSRTPAPGPRPGRRVPVIVRAAAPPPAAAGQPRDQGDPGTTTKAESDALLRQALVKLANERGLDAHGAMALVRAGATRHLAAQTQAENVQAVTTTYDAVFGPGAFVADTRS